MKRVFTALLVVCLCGSTARGATVTKLLDRSAAVHSASGDGVVVDSTDYYGSGNDDNFGEYGLATFSFTAGDFGGTSVVDIVDIELTLTHNDRPFSDGTRFGLFFTTDDFDATYTGLSYDDSGANNPGGVDTSQFTNYSFLVTVHGVETDIREIDDAG